MRPGKFDSDLDEAIWQASLDGGPDEEAGSVDEIGIWSGLLRDGESLADVIASNNPDLDVEQLRTEGAAGVIITEDDQGFVKVYYYDDSEALHMAWAETEEEAEPQEEGDDFEPNRSDLRRDRIQEALSYVHYWERRERGKDQMDRAEAAKAAIRISGLNDAEADVLLNALHVSRSELAAARNPGKPPPPPPRGKGDTLRRLHRLEHQHRTTEKLFDPAERHPRETKAHHFAVNHGTKTLMQAVIESGLPHDHHESDLYIKDSPEARALIEQYGHFREGGKKFRPFTSQIDHERWLEVPFSYEGKGHPHQPNAMITKNARIPDAVKELVMLTRQGQQRSARFAQLHAQPGVAAELERYYQEGSTWEEPGAFFKRARPRKRS